MNTQVIKDSDGNDEILIEPQKLVTKNSKKPTADNANFLELLELDVLLPEDPIFAPALKITAIDERLGGFIKPVVGTGAVSLETKCFWGENFVPLNMEFFDTEAGNADDNAGADGAQGKAMTEEEKALAEEKKKEAEEKASARAARRATHALQHKEKDKKMTKTNSKKLALLQNTSTSLKMRNLERYLGQKILELASLGHSVRLKWLIEQSGKKTRRP